MPSPAEHAYVSRAGLKLRHALETFGVEPRGQVCADFGCNVGGFTDCLLRAGAACVYAVDTGYGALAWTLRNDPRVSVHERSNALHLPPPGKPGGPPHRGDPTLIVIDMGWTPQRLCIPAAARWLRDSPAPADRRIITLVKPHYELLADEKRLLTRGVLPEDVAERTVKRTLAELPTIFPGVSVAALTRSPLLGGAGKGNSAGNAEWLALLEVSHLPSV